MTAACLKSEPRLTAQGARFHLVIVSGEITREEKQLRSVLQRNAYDFEQQMIMMQIMSRLSSDYRR